MNKIKNEDLELELRREDADFLDLSRDFEYVKNLNTNLAAKYQELMDCFPTASELQITIDHVKTGKQGYTEKMQKERVFKLKKFQSALKCLEAQDTNVIPVKYEELNKGETNEDK